MITSKEAAEVAKAHGLSLSDAAALARMADSVAEAEEVAELFKPAEVDMNKSIRGKVAARRQEREGLFRGER